MYISESMIESLFLIDPDKMKQSYISERDPASPFKKVNILQHYTDLCIMHFELIDKQKTNSFPMEYLIKRLQSYNNKNCYDLSKLLEQRIEQNEIQKNNFQKIKNKIVKVDIQTQQQYRDEIFKNINQDLLVMYCYTINENDGSLVLKSQSFGTNLLKTLGYNLEELENTIIDQGIPHIVPEIDLLERTRFRSMLQNFHLNLLCSDFNAKTHKQLHNGAIFDYNLFKQNGERLTLKMTQEFYKYGNLIYWIAKSAEPQYLTFQPKDLNSIKNNLQAL